MNENLVRRVEAGDIIKPWLILGPLYEDLSKDVVGLSYFERPGATVGRSAMAQVVEDAAAILQGASFEGAEAEFRGQQARWRLVRRPTDQTRIELAPHRVRSRQRGCHYALIQVRSPAIAAAWLQIYCAGSFEAWWNGRRCFSGNGGPVPQTVDGIDDPVRRRPDRVVVAPQPVRGKIARYIGHAGNFVQRLLENPGAGRAPHAIDGKIQVQDVRVMTGSRFPGRRRAGFE